MNRGRGRSQKPNRGGGRFSKPKTDTRAVLRSSIEHDKDEVEVSEGDEQSEEEYDDFVAEIRQTTTGKSSTTPGKTRRRSSNKALIQRLHMSIENQQLVEGVLRRLKIHVHRNSHDFQENLDLSSREMKRNEAYWRKVGERKLVVEGAVHFGEFCETETERKDYIYSSYALKKLLQCGFDKTRCLDALKGNGGDLGAALESLLCNCCNLSQIGKKNPAYSEEKFQEAVEQRKDEVMALEAIYGDAFTEVISNSIWTIKLSLPFLLAAFKPQKSETSGHKTQSARKREIPTNICKFFMGGHCRFENKCRFSHVINDGESNSNGMKSTSEIGESNHELTDQSLPFILEIRFSDGSLYPFEPPVVAFYSTNELIPSVGCLNVTLRLNKEAKDLSITESPAIFCLASLLENEQEIMNCYKMTPSEYSLPVKKSIIAPDIGLVENGASKKGASIMKPKIKKLQQPSEELTIQKKNTMLKQQFERLQSVAAYKSMLEERKKLPAWKSQQNITETLKETQVVVISGMTGCGKTTQIPQFILDSFIKEGRGGECFIICTQPRRISAMSVAERVSAERIDKIGESVGYQVRLENKQSSRTSLVYCTTGILLRRLEGESSLPGVSHVIVDEVHERTEEGDFLMMVLKDLLTVRPDLRVVLMSATLNAQLFSQYFFEAPVIHIPGRTFPVKEMFLEDALEMTKFQVDLSSPYAKPMASLSVPNIAAGKKNKNSRELQQIQDAISCTDFRPPDNEVDDQNLSEDQMAWRYANYSKSTILSLVAMDHEKINYDLLVTILEWIVAGEHEYPKTGAILVFLPGMGEIITLLEELQNNRTFSPKSSDRFRIFPLHSTLSSEEQSLVFKKQKEGVRKIVLSTNIAETSVTIDDVVFVIDCGRMKENRYDSTKGMECLDEVWVSQANARQRRGRAGRVTSGVCFHLFTSYRFEHKMAGHQVPEIQRVPLEKLCLRIKVLELFIGRDVKDVLGKLLQPPSDESINESIKRLHDIGAFDSDENLTPLGYHLAALPVDVRIGKLILLGAIFGCLDPVLTIGAILSYRSPFSAPFDKREEADKKRQEMAVANSDHLTLLNSYKGWLQEMERGMSAGYHYCRTNFLSMKTLQMIASLKCQYAELLADIGFIQADLTARKMKRLAPRTGDGVLLATGEMMNVNSKNQKLVLGIVCGALFPNVVQVVKPDIKYKATAAGAIPVSVKAAELKFWTKNDGQVFVHPKSVNFQVNNFDSPYLVYHEKVKTSKVYIRDCSMVSMYALLLFCGDSLSLNLEKGVFVISIDDGWIRFSASSRQIATLLQDLRMELDRLLESKIENPGSDNTNCEQSSTIINAIVQLISTQ
ncbi:putative ATP-dependent RNA helicase DHX57 isoform X2 [Montipora foliosa]